MIAVGFGCRAGCPHEDILGALDAALTRAGRGRAEIEALYAPKFKGSETVLSQVAELLGKPLVFVAREALHAQADSALTASPHSLEHTGLPSVAETSALAGAGHGARLLGPRQIVGGATCALAAARSGA